jgi:uncharacterized protein YggE
VRTVSVTGHGEARVVPDSAVVRVATVHRADSVADALAGADSAARQTIATARVHTAPERIGSTSVQVWPAHDQQGAAVGFEARHSLTIRCADTDAAGALLAALAAAVGDRLQVEGVSLDVTDRSAAETAAREAAYADAVERATHLADLAGSDLGDAYSLIESGYAEVPLGVARRATRSQVALEPGEMSVSSSLTVTFQLLGGG